jgi:purine-cytosine permease-like protein
MASFEAIGVETIPEDQRTSTPWTFVAIVVGGDFSIGIVVFGWVAITLGLSFWGALLSLLVGVTVGLPFLIPLILIGSRTATNNSTSSGAHFGVRGRLVGSFVGLFISMVITAITIWTCGDVGMAALHRLFHVRDTATSRGISYTVATLCVAVIVVYGYHVFVRFEKFLLVAGGVMILLMIPAFVHGFRIHYPGIGYGSGGFWNAWLTSMVVVGVGGPIGFVTFLGDWTRYISPARYPARRLLPIALLAVWVSQVLPAAFGLLVATAFRNPLADFGTSLVNGSPLWYAIILLPFVVLGSIGLASQSMYSCGLDLDAIVPRLSRAQATVLTSAVSLGLILVGSIAFNAEGSISAASVWLVATATPWAVVTGIGFIRCRGRYSADDLQVFNRRQRGGQYWFVRGWNFRAVAAWLIGTTVGILGTNTSLYEGPIARSLSGLDFSFIESAVVAAAVYLALLAIFPEQQRGGLMAIEEATAKI